MRIALTSAHCFPDVLRGGERYLHELSRGLARAGHDVTVWSSSTIAPGAAVEDGVHIVRLPRHRSDAAHESRFGWRLLPRLLRQRYDVVHSLGPSDALAGVIAAKLGRTRRTVFTNLGLPDKDLWRARRDWRYHEAVVRGVDVYACLSHYAAGVFERSYGRPASVTAGGVNLASFRPADAREQEPTLLFVGTFDDPMKNVGVLLDGFACVLDRVPEARLWLLGPGDVERHLSSVSDRVRASVEVLPRGRTDITKWYQRAWVTVLPSKWESFALVLVESLASGTPIVAANHSASTERVTPGCGVLCRPDDPVALADACVSALDLARAPGIVARCRESAEPYDWDVQVAMYEAIYDGTASLPAATVPPPAELTRSS